LKFVCNTYNIKSDRNGNRAPYEAHADGRDFDECTADFDHFLQDVPGIVARVTGNLFEQGANMLEAQQFDDTESGRFFMRVVFDPGEASADALRSALRARCAAIGMDWTCATPRKAPRGADGLEVRPLPGRSALSHADRRTADGRGGDHRQPSQGSAVDLADRRHSLSPPADHADTKPQQEAEVKRIVTETGAELVVLARYMQILSDDLAAFLSGRCINIHHSFLPSFKGAKPYHQAHARG
jgi:formyltetrahydrofolate deformylase